MKTTFKCVMQKFLNKNPKKHEVKTSKSVSIGAH